jgi:hypothetical protein
MYEITFNGRQIGETCATHFCKETRAARTAALALEMLTIEYECMTRVSIKRVA